MKKIFFFLLRKFTNTITRAESAAILAALQCGTYIATDSAASMYQLKNMMMTPMRMRHHKSRYMLQAILEKIKDNGHIVKIYKVKAHTGIVGNEYADEAAKRATELLRDETTNEIPIKCPVQATPPCTTIFWPTKRQDSHTWDTSQTTNQSPLWMDDLGKALKNHLHPLHKLGHSNAQSMYYKLWQEVTLEADCNCSTAYLSDPTLTRQNKSLTFQARCGQTNTANQRYKYGMAATNTCLLCPEPDGVFHTLGGCAHMKGMYIQRHNEAVWIILRTLLRSKLGASVVMHDAGHRHDGAALREVQAAEWELEMEQEEARDDPRPDKSPTNSNPLGTRIPEWVYDTPLGEQQTAAEWNKFRPDILIATRGGANLKDRIDSFYARRIHIIEIKYCRDTDRTMQSMRAESQHAQLRDALARIGYRQNQVHMHTITLGATGTIYKDIHTTLATLGVDTKTARRQCCTALHRHAVTYIKKILTTKWAQEQATQRRRPG